MYYATYAFRPDKREPMLYWHANLDDAMRTAMSAMLKIRADYGHPGWLYSKAIGTKANLAKLREITGEPRLDIQIGLFALLPPGAKIEPRPVRVVRWKHAREADLEWWRTGPRGATRYKKLYEAMGIQ